MLDIYRKHLIRAEIPRLSFPMKFYTCTQKKRIVQKTAPDFSEYLVFAFSELSRYVVFYSVLGLIESHYEKNNLYHAHMKTVLLFNLSPAVIAHCLDIFMVIRVARFKGFDDLNEI